MKATLIFEDAPTPDNPNGVRISPLTQCNEKEKADDSLAYQAAMAVSEILFESGLQIEPGPRRADH